MISDAARAILELPDHFIDTRNLTAMSTFAPIVERLLAVRPPRLVVEIGAEYGFTSRWLTDVTARLGAELHIVDPTYTGEADAPHVTVFKEPSLAYLAREHRPDVALVDGDHNYETVMSELLALARPTPLGPCLMLLNDVSWPCARRDAYYAPGTLPNAWVRQPRPHACGSVGLENEGLEGHRGFPSGTVFAWALEHGGSGNGVLTAVEDFRAANDGWDYLQIPSIYGLGVLWRPDGYDAAGQAIFTEVRAALAWLRPMLAVLEANRLRLVQSCTEWEDTCNRTVAALAATQAALSERQEELSSLQDELRRDLVVRGWRKLTRVLFAMRRGGSPR